MSLLPPKLPRLADNCYSNGPGVCFTNKQFRVTFSVQIYWKSPLIVQSEMYPRQLD